MHTKKLIRITTVPISLRILLKGQLRFMSNHFEVIGVSSSGSDLEEVKRNEGIAIVPVEMSREITPVKDLISLFKLYFFLKREKPFIVHTHTPKAGILGMLAAQMARIPHRLHTVAGLPLMEARGLKRKILNEVEKLTYACATKVYPNSKGIYDFILENNYTTSNKLKVIGNGSSNGIDTTFFACEQISEEQQIKLKNELGIEAGDFVFVFVGRLVGDKGINELVKAFAQLTAYNPQLKTHKLLLVGPLESELDPLRTETLTEINTNQAIVSVGFQSDVRPYFALSDVLVFPSYREGFPNVVLQAGAMGLPCIVTDINGCNEIVMDDQNGIIIPVKNADALYEAMLKMMTNTGYKNKLKTNARPMIVSRYEQQLVWDEILVEYKNLEKNV